MASSITALLLAGRRPGTDPLAAHFGVADKALIEIAGEPMLSRVARVLVDHPAIGRVIVVAQEPERLLGAIPWLAQHPAISGMAGGMSVSRSVADAIAANPDALPFLLTTADNVLLDRQTLDTFISGATGHDLAVGLVERRTLLASYPSSKRTWLHFRGGSWSGANLFWFGDLRAREVLSVWQKVEQKRKRGSAVLRAFGPMMLIAIALRTIGIHEAIRKVGRRLGLDADVIALPCAEACIDVDTPADHALAETILAAREGRSARFEPGADRVG